jgi:hypothetical protein
MLKLSGIGSDERLRKEMEGEDDEVEAEKREVED